MKIRLFFLIALFFFFGYIPNSFAFDNTDYTTLLNALPYSYEGETYTDVICIYSGISSESTGCFYYNYTGGFFPLANTDLIENFPNADFLVSSTSPILLEQFGWISDPEFFYRYLYSSPSSVNFMGTVLYSSRDVFYGFEGGIWQEATIIGDAPPENDSILSPLNQSYNPVGTFNFSGECTHPGVNYSMNFRAFSWDSTPSITCNEDYTWSNDFYIAESGGGGKEYFLYNHETSEYVSISVSGYNSDSLDWFAGIKYPEIDSNNFAEVVSDSEFPLRIQYRVPEVDRENTSIILRQCESDYSSNCTVLLNNSLDFFDELKTGFFETTLDFSITGFKYFDLDLLNETSSTVEFNQKSKISIVAEENSTSITQPAQLPDKKDLGYFGNIARDLFIPSYGFVPTQILFLKNDFYSAFPIFEQIDSVINSNQLADNTAQPQAITLSLFGSTPTNVFNFSIFGDSILQMRFWIGMFFWFYCLVFCIKAVRNLIHPGQLKMDL